MKKEEILKEIIEKEQILIVLADGSEKVFSRNEEGMWKRDCWGAAAYLDDEELATELKEDYGEDLELIL